MTSDVPWAGLLAGRTMVVAGVGPGLGGQVARLAVQAGAAVVLGARSERYGTELAKELGAEGGSVVFQQCDITAPVDCTRLVDSALSYFGAIDVIVPVAMSGAGGGIHLEHADFDDWRMAFDVNLFGALNVVQAAIPALRKSSAGSVIFIGSQITRRVFPGRGSYASSKAALLGAAKVLAAELGADGVRVNTVVPGRMWGPSLRSGIARLAIERGTTDEEQVQSWKNATALKRLATDEECGRTVIFLASDLSAAITGQTIDANAGETMQ